MPRGQTSAANRYARMIEPAFHDNLDLDTGEAAFTRGQLAEIASSLGIRLPKNLGDVLYSFRYRYPLPQSILDAQPKGREYVIFPDGRSQYRFVAVPFAAIRPTPGMQVIKVPDATPGLIDMYSLSDEQALLAKLRYNRLLDTYTGITTYSLQSHLRTTIPECQLETDEIYVGIDARGAHYVFPVQAKGGDDFLSVVQIWQDFKMCEAKSEFSDLLARPVGAQFMADDVIGLFSFSWDGDYGVTIAPGSERHYKLVPPSELSEDELRAYMKS